MASLQFSDIRHHQLLWFTNRHFKGFKDLKTFMVKGSKFLNQKAMMCTSEVKLKYESKRKFHQYVEEEVMQLKKRLTHLEEETNMMKQEILQNRAERKTLLNDLYQQLKLIHVSLHPENQTFGYKFCKEGWRSDGLSQVLYEDWNPSVVIRGGLGASSVADPGSAESIRSNILCIEYKN